MKTRKLLSITVLTLFLGVSALAQIQTIEWQGMQRQYMIKTPENYESLPVLFFLHGLGDNISHVNIEHHFEQYAEKFNWMIVIPQAVNEGNGTMWNAALMNSSIDDSGFLMALLDSLAVQYPINQDSVFFTGFSMGGFMSHRMAIEHGDRINAAAPVSGLITHAMANQTAVAPVRMLHIHGTNDNVVGDNGYSQYFGSNLGLGVDAILNYWRNANGCTDEPIIDSLPDTHNDGLRFVQYVYSGNKELRFLKVIGGTHSWYRNANQHDIDYMTYIHDFFTGKISHNSVNSPTTGSLNVYPNPTTGQIKIELESPATIEIVDIQGRTIIQKQLESGIAFIDLDGIQSGVYFLKGNGATSKLVIE
ncbi:MAG: T9SS type A sorting domain-containing protein [Bacteroidales bacterium]|nr:T9SS type A sorting domain-containing protein [Bacteroidales bacterium]